MRLNFLEVRHISCDGVILVVLCCYLCSSAANYCVWCCTESCGVYFFALALLVHDHLRLFDCILLFFACLHILSDTSSFAIHVPLLYHAHLQFSAQIKMEASLIVFS